LTLRTQVLSLMLSVGFQNGKDQNIRKLLRSWANT